MTSAGVFDVAVVGYGPVGQLLAALLGQRGLRVLVLEKHQHLYGKPRAGHCDGETMRTFQSLGLAETLELLMRPITSYELVGADWKVLHRIAIGQSGSGWKASYLFHQPQLEDVLDAAARSYPHVELRRNLEVTALSQDGDGVTLSGDGASGSETFRARYVVGADGGNSAVRNLLGIGRTDLGFAPFEFLVVDFEHADPDRALPAMGEVRQVLDPARPTTAGRWNGNRWSRWEFMRMPGETREQMESDETCWQFLEPWGLKPGDGTIVRRTVYTFESQLAQRWRDRRVLLAGDAAHTMPPFMAQGLCSGFRDALNLSWKLDLVLRDSVKGSLLDSYERERKPHVEAITQMAMSVGALVTETDPHRAQARDAALAAGDPVLPHGFPVLNDGLLARGAGNALAPLAGQPAPQARAYRDGRVARLDDHIGCGWRIVTRHALKDQINGHAPLLRALDMSCAHVTRGCLADSFLDIDADYASWFAQNGVELFVQRPDMYIFGAAAKVADLPQLLESLDTQMRGHGLCIGAGA